jgi:putative ABC transport system ATP-binding protein
VDKKQQRLIFKGVFEVPIMETQKLCRDFKLGGNTVKVLKDINISIEKGALTIIKGRSGSGKTTLLNILGILDVPTTGKVFLKGIEVSSLNEYKRDEIRRTDIGFVFQSVALISTLSAYENVEFALRIADYNIKERRTRTEECLNKVGLGNRMDHRPGELSGGEQQRIAIARAIAHKPDIVFADEPTAELDTHMSLQIIRLFKSLVVQEGITIVMSTHDPGMLEVADRVLTIEDGEIYHE